MNVLLLSGGLDSVTLLHENRFHGNSSIFALLINYGQKHADNELACAKYHCEKLDVKFKEIALHQHEWFKRSSLITGGEGSIVVPFRNGLFLSIAATFAANHGFDYGFDRVLIACNKTDAAVFPDCRPDFIAAVNQTLRMAELQVRVFAPYIELSKVEIVKRAYALKVEIPKTWSCYNPVQSMPCGICLACQVRAEALTEAAAMIQ